MYIPKFLVFTVVCVALLSSEGRSQTGNNVNSRQMSQPVASRNYSTPAASAVQSSYSVESAGLSVSRNSNANNTVSAYAGSNGAPEPMLSVRNVAGAGNGYAETVTPNYVGSNFGYARHARSLEERIATAPSSNAYVSPGSGKVLGRYSKVLGRYYYYCTSEETRKKCIDQRNKRCAKGDVAALAFDYSQRGNVPSFLGFGWATYSQCGSFFYPLGYKMLLRDRQMMPDNTSKHSNSSQFYSFDGYVVHNTDTIAGVVTITHNMVALENFAGQSNIVRYTNNLKNPSLKSITVYKGVKELNMVRLGADKHLSRVVHDGKLRIYDKSYEFLTAQNIEKKLLVEDVATGEFVKVNSTAELINLVNKKYGLSITPDKQSREELMLMVNRLD